MTAGFTLGTKPYLFLCLASGLCGEVVIVVLGCGVGEYFSGLEFLDVEEWKNCVVSEVAQGLVI